MTDFKPSVVDGKPKCFDNVDEYNLWHSATSKLSNHADNTPCKDCTREYQIVMQTEHRCGNKTPIKPPPEEH